LEGHAHCSALELHEAQTEFEHSTDLVLNLMNSMKCPCQ